MVEIDNRVFFVYLSVALHRENVITDFQCGNMRRGTWWRCVHVLVRVGVHVCGVINSYYGSISDNSNHSDMSLCTEIERKGGNRTQNRFSQLLLPHCKTPS